MVNNDLIIHELDNILSSTFGFERSGEFQINGKTEDIGISQSFLNDNFFSFNYINKPILHFTSLSSAFLILNSQIFIARSLESISDDNEELIHCLKLLDQYNETINEQKKYTFVACFTPLGNETKIENFEQHWVEYGNSHTGVAFEFEIIKQPLFPDHFSLNVNYFDLIEGQHKLLTYLTNNVTDSLILKALIPFFACIKHKNFHSEKEVRLLVQYDNSIIEQGHYDESNIGFSISKENKAIYYYKIPFCLNAEAENDKLFRLNKIYIGKKAENNDGQTIILNRLIPLLKSKGIIYEWLK